MGENINEGSVKQPVNVKVTGPAPLTSRIPAWCMGLLYGVAALVVMAAVSLVTVRLMSPEVVVFDMKGTMDSFLQQSVQMKLDEEGAKKLTSRFNAALTGSLTDWQQKHHAVILVSPAVVSQQRDITGEIRNDIAVRMKEGQ
ncbi:type-F conjugative transfer system protein TrbI [Cronobacter sakazakii]|uniref:type-F conjugative transfer system protein TrbI n=1 Tax=Cronobacter sakazakii TaxID=28141 RepID=UPI00345E7424